MRLGPVLMRGCLAGLFLGSASVAGAQVGAVPPPPEQQTADCRAPVYATDQLVCDDAALRALDRELASLLASGAQPSLPWAEPHAQWFRRRSRCAFAEDHRACVAAAYRERLAVLRPPGAAVPRQDARCDSPAVAAIAVTAEWIILLDRNGDVQGAAATRSGESPWQPFLRAAQRGATFTMRTAGGARLRCRLAGKGASLRPEVSPGEGLPAPRSASPPEPRA